ncbi:6-hydroxymethylpterin diphosphokinase MptE-like protein [Treponema sp. R6D11]
MNNTHYTFLTSRTGEIVPAIITKDGSSRPLHSTIDPIREAQRLVSTIPQDTGFVIFLGLCGGFAQQLALSNTSAQIVVIDFNKDGIKELLSSKDYTPLLSNGRFSLLTDFTLDEIKKYILEHYNPALQGGIKVLPMRTRTEHDSEKFEKAASVIQEAIDIAASDFSVQAHFGLRWFSNIIRNIKTAETADQSFCVKKTDKAAIVAAGPSLDGQITALAEYSSKGVFIICSDTALPVLLHNNIEPDAVVSIDCQHISHYHFFGCNIREIPLILDIARPTWLSRFATWPVFFSIGHPRALYISRYWRSLPLLDTSGGNVTYACLSLAQTLGAKHITLFGADFSYVRSQTYARGTYVYPYFNRRQNRLSPAEAQMSTFLYRSPFLPKENENQIYHETSSLRFYRKKLEEKAAAMDAQISAFKGEGAPINLTNKVAHNANNKNYTFGATENQKKSGIEFLEQYRNDIVALPASELNEKQRQIFTTLLPTAAAIKHRSTNNKTAAELIEETKNHCINQIEKILETH